MIDKKDTTEDSAEKQPLIASLEAMTETETEGLKLVQIPPRDYDLKIIDKFISTVFHSGYAEGENLLTWMVGVGRSPAKPIAYKKLTALLGATRNPKALYFGTSLCMTEPETGALRNKQGLFSSLHVVVLDDIGTKVPMEKIPKDFPPSYIIETSEGNFQYGYVLDEPIEDLAAATALIQLVYESGCSDEGGKMANKLVRMPEGVNTKKEKFGFVSTLTELNKTVYTPQEVLDALDLNTNWDDVLADAEEVTKRRAGNSVGSTPWASTAPVAASLSGVIDPVLEWLYEQELVSGDNSGEYVEIRCPNHHSHTNGEETAGYKPLGRGANLAYRHFNCFHDSCSDIDTPTFLKSISSQGGPEAGVFDPAAGLTTQYVYDRIGDRAWDLKAFRRDTKISMTAFANLHPHHTTVYTADGKPKSIGMTSLWKTSPSRVVVDGAVFDPSTTARIVEKDEAKYVNLFSVPMWGHGSIDKTHVAKFNEYLEYLLPVKFEREYFIMWLAAKVQDMSFRGAAIVMVAPKQGVGRSTLADMVRTLMGASNVANVPLRDMLGDSDFNEWQMKPFIVTEETMAAGKKDFYTNYERLKTIIDPRAGHVTINHKYGGKMDTEVYGSNLFLTNHINAIALPPEDRRFMVMENAYRPAAPAYFTALNTWLDEKDIDGLPLWGRHVYRHLQSLDVDLEYLTAPPPKTDSKISMEGASLSDLDMAVQLLVELWPDSCITAGDVYEVLSHPSLAGPLHFDDDTNKKYVRTLLNQQTIGYPDMLLKINGKPFRPRVLTDAHISGTADVKLYKKGDKRAQTAAAESIKLLCIARKPVSEIAAEVHEQLQLAERIL